MSDRYMVKWGTGADKHYGIYQYRGIVNKEEYKGVPRGITLVEDAIFPVMHQVSEKELVDVPFSLGAEDEYSKYVDKEFKKAQVLSDSLPARKVGVGAMFSVGVGDGSAYYVVTKVGKATCDVEWRGFCPDRWTDHYWGWGRGRKRVAIAEVQRYLRGLWGI